MRADDLQDNLEVERYELAEAPLYRFELSRRDFCRALGGGLLVMLVLPRAASGQESGRSGRSQRGGGVPDEVGAWIRIGADGKVTACTGKVEVGQGIRTSLAQAVADELRTGVEAITMIMGDTDQTPYDRGTFGSQSTPVMSLQLRRAAAAAREELLTLAAGNWQVSAESVEIRNGKLHHKPTGRSASFGELTQDKTLTREIAPADDVASAGKWTVAGEPVPNVNGRDIVTGAHRYPSDQRRDGMLYGRVLRPASFEAELISVDLSGAENRPGVVVLRDGNFVGVAAPTPLDAEHALAAVRAEWSKPEHPSESSLFEYFRKIPSSARAGEDAARLMKATWKRGFPKP